MDWVWVGAGRPHLSGAMLSRAWRRATICAATRRSLAAAAAAAPSPSISITAAPAASASAEEDEEEEELGRGWWSGAASAPSAPTSSDSVAGLSVVVVLVSACAGRDGSRRRTRASTRCKGSYSNGAVNGSNGYEYVPTSSESSGGEAGEERVNESDVEATQVTGRLGSASEGACNTSKGKGSDGPSQGCPPPPGGTRARA